ncbi:DUF2786 domain-containing protein [Corynebacterium mucifaciens]|uniref:DUF2786 domain-containing protein n=1 Tax=Corynebacterium mucifaciens TaxID=57171 RepID=A0A7X6LSJ7_9CORY|nr:DUF2786 domain-containing protein [Corynebacterium mucifaciens]NKY69604.1 DUF2786 domain-containing protein [Corynebacterium mucifaciens]
MQNIDKLKSKVAKLLAQAEDPATPDTARDAFYSRAAGIMAKYGFEARDLDNPDEGDEVITRTYALGGAYTDMQAMLLNGIANALHCVGLQAKYPRSTKVKSMTVFGTRRNMERVDMLNAMLAPRMVAQAKMERQNDAWEPSTTVKRRSFMVGFITTISQRLREAEGTVGDEEGRYALALIDDQDKAEKARDEYVAEHGFVMGEFRQRRTYDSRAVEAGRAAGQRSDIGQTRIGGRIAIG